MITTEQEARAAVAKVGPDAVAVADIVAAALYGDKAPWNPATVRYVASIYSAQGRPRKYAQLFRIYAEWAIDNQKTAMFKAAIARRLSTDQLMHQAGYRAEPFGEPKMVTVRSEDLALAIAAMICHDNEGISNGDQYKRLRAALDGAK